MRFSFLLILFLATQSFAEPIEYDWNAGSTAPAKEPPLDLTIELFTNHASFTVFDIEPNAGTPQTWLITEDVAAEYDLDWEAYQAGLRDPAYLIWHAVPQVPRAWSPDFDLQEIEVEVVYRWHDFIPQDRFFSRGWVARGEGTIVPEPASGVLLLLGAIYLPWRKGCLMNGMKSSE